MKRREIEIVPFFRWLPLIIKNNYENLKLCNNFFSTSRSKERGKVKTRLDRSEKYSLTDGNFPPCHFTFLSHFSQLDIFDFLNISSRAFLFSPEHVKHQIERRMEGLQQHFMIDIKLIE